MKTILLLPVLVSLISGPVAIIPTFTPHTLTSVSQPQTLILSQITETEKLTEVIQRLIFPFLYEEVQKRYGSTTTLDYYNIKIQQLEYNTSGPYVSDMILTLEFQPYTGPHNSVAKDVAILEIKVGKVVLLSYETITTY